MGDPLLPEASHVTVDRVSSIVAATLTGANGTPAGTTGAEGGDTTELPTVFFVTTVKV
jgi:hypothetical protein